MTRQERWIYRDMLDVYYDTERPLPCDLGKVCAMVGARGHEDQEIVASILLLKFRLTDTGYVNDRCDEEIAGYKAKAEVAQLNGKKGGRPSKNNPAKPSRLLLGSDPVSGGLASGSDPVSKLNPAETGSKANQEPITKNHKPVKLKPEAATPAALPDWLPADCWTAFVEMRKAIKKPLTPGGIPLAMQKLDTLRAAGNDPRAVLEQSTLNSWQGLFEIKAQYAKHGAQSQKFNFANADRSGDQLAQAESMARHGITSIPDGDIEI